MDPIKILVDRLSATADPVEITKLQHQIKAAVEQQKLIDSIKEDEKKKKEEEREQKRKEKQDEKSRLKAEQETAKELLLAESIEALMPYIEWRRHLMGDKPMVKYYLRSSLDCGQVTEFISADRTGLTADIGRFLATTPATAIIYQQAKEYYHHSKRPATMRTTEVAEYIIHYIVEKKKEMDFEPMPLSNNKLDCCKVYVDLDSFVPGPTPCWDSFLGRISTPDSFLAFIFSLFVAEDKGRQICWLRDNGGGGKSTMTKAIIEALGHCVVATIDGNKLADKFFFASCVGKRLLIEPDCQLQHFISHSRVHNISGGDIVAVERKFQDIVHEKVYSKMLVCSNYYPAIDREKNQESRLIPFNMIPRDTDISIDLAWEKGMIDEMPFLLFKAKECYKRLSKDFLIPVDREMFDRCYSTDESEINTFLINQGYKLDESRVCFATDLKDEFTRVFNKKNTSHKAVYFRFGQFERLLYTQLRVTKHFNSSSVAYYKGIGKAGAVVDPESRTFVEEPDAKVIAKQGFSNDMELLS